MIALLNLSCLFLGLISWLIPIIIIIMKKISNKKRYISIFISMSICLLSIYLQSLYIKYLININDWTALMDIIGTSIVLEFIMILVNIILNCTILILLNKYEEK
ncbi:hypothetical protein H9660_00240 [Clostridium sp. Sa3CUN1]|uniref:Uncharacterized protein n=1 Tax=Clostridium gallinarum TaxID=2762246 RepID=A0ABR8PZH1_9CLOT|nr:hypothetical protein [Clostridium gallinarum]MBD7913565.1 hypothetical protein [Clostridium gallinarum]